MAKPLIIDDITFTSYFPKDGYEVGYTSVDGGQGGVLLNGEVEEDELSVKAEITLPCMPLSSAQISTLLGVVYSSKYHKVTYYDPRFGTRTITARRSVKNVRYRGHGSDGVEYWTGLAVVFTEK